MNPVRRAVGLLCRFLDLLDSRAVPTGPAWGVAARIWGDPRWSFLCLLFLLGCLLHPPDGLPFRLCLFHLMFGVDCPGCGMTRGLSHLLRGHGVAALRFHPFSPLILTYLIAQSLSPFLPSEARTWVASQLNKYQMPLGILFWALAGLFVLYGLGRASVQLLLQEASSPVRRAPSFRMGW